MTAMELIEKAEEWMEELKSENQYKRSKNTICQQSRLIINDLIEVIRDDRG